MTSAELLVDAVGRIREIVHRVVDGLTPKELAFRLDPEANSIAWLVWHLTRIQDDHLADAFQAEQVWTAGGWMERFGLPFDPRTPATDTRPRTWPPCRWTRAPAGRVLRHSPPADPRVRGPAHRCRPWPRSGPLLGSAGDPGGAAGERDRRRPPARRPGGLDPRHPAAQEGGPMITGAHAILYSDDADATRATWPRSSGPGRSTPAAAG